MGDKKENSPRAAVRCQKCNKILAFKIGSASGFLQLKCPMCKSEIKVDLSLRRGRIYNRTADYTLTIAFL